jgi:addiction module HigA family antidote
MLPIHPGRILKRELAARDLSANRLALGLRVASGRITDILNGKRGVTPETALRLARFFGTSADFWMNLQSRYDLTIAEQSIGAKVTAEVEQMVSPTQSKKRRKATIRKVDASLALIERHASRD